MWVKEFWELDCWKEARVLTNQVYEINFSKDFGLQDQIRRSSLSIMANIAEGFGRQSNLEFIRFLDIARASSSETQSHLFISYDLKYIDENKLKNLINQCQKTGKIITGLIKKLREKK